MSTLDLCEKFFDKRNVYELLEISKDAELKDIKKAYYRLSLQVHPDRVSETEKAEATEKFKVLSKVYQVLTDKDKRALYDEQGIIDDDDEMESKLTNWLDLWRKIFKPLTIDDISNYEKSYVGSELERNDIKKSYLSSKGCINQMMNEVPFLKVEEEERLQQIVRELIEAGEVPEYKQFTEEPAAKRNRRHKKHARESKIAEKLKKKHLEKNKAETEEDGNDFGDLAQALLEKKKSRENTFDTLMDKLMQKYGNDDGDDGIDINSLGKRSAKKRSRKEPKGNLNNVKKGKVTKAKKI